MEPRKIHQLSLEVFQLEGRIVTVDKANIQFLKDRAASNPRGRARLCAHPTIKDSIHEMLVVQRKDNWIRPHKHGEHMVESFHCIEGEMLVCLFEDDGTAIKSIYMGDYSSGRPFYYRHTRPTYHTHIPLTDFIVFQEVTQGPFDKNNLNPAPWAPADNTVELQAYLESLKNIALNILP